MNRSIRGYLFTAILLSTFVMPSPAPHANSTPSLLQVSDPSKSKTIPPNMDWPVPAIAQAPEAELQHTIQEFLGRPFASICGDSSTRGTSSFDVLIVTVPDPVETHLSLFFDRTIDALQQALIRMGYLFAGASLPWESNQHPEAQDWRIRLSEHQFQTSREEMPGLLIYRKPSFSGGAAKPLFVLVVGETPTTGIHKDQFLKALAYFNCWSGDPDGHAKKRLRILGPTFSGSLYSMLELLGDNEDLRNYDIYLHSGTITGKLPAEDFEKELTQRHLPNVHYASFQENDEYALQQFLLYLRNLGFKQAEKSEHKGLLRRYLAALKKLIKKTQPAEGNAQNLPQLPRITKVVLLTEDETAYGNTGQESRPAIGQGTSKLPDRSLLSQISFPRDISHLRSAYQHDLLKGESFPERKIAPRTSLPLDLDDIGGDKDTVPVYALRQTPLSQESVLFGIITNLKKLSPDFVVIRATNPLDELFLARFLTKSYPQVRVVTIGADLLFLQQRDDNLLSGILAISPYSLRPDTDRYLPPIVPSQSEHLNVLTFPSTLSAGVYNATLSLVACQAQLSSRDCESAPAAPYHEYGWSREWPENDASEPAYKVAQPSLWLLVLGRDGYWPLARLNSKSLTPDTDAAATPRTIPETKPALDPKYSGARHLTKDWTRFGIVFALTSITFCVLCWIGAAESGSQLISAFDQTPDPHRAFLLTFLATLVLLGVCGTFLPYVLAFGYDSYYLYLVFFFALIPLVLYIPINLRHREATIHAWFFTGACLFVMFLLLALSLVGPSRVDHLQLFRMEHITSGVSPALPIYLLITAAFWWCWSALEGQALLDFRCPQLPRQTSLKKLSNVLPNFLVSDISYEGNQKLTGILRSPFSGLPEFLHHLLDSVQREFYPKRPPWPMLRAVGREAFRYKADLWTTGRISLPVIFIIILALGLLDFRHPIYTLEGMVFDVVYAYALCFALFLLLTDLSRLAAGWVECRRLLRALEQLPLRRSFTGGKEFSWRPIWRLGAGPQRVLAREWETWRQFCLYVGEPFGNPGTKTDAQHAFFAERSGEVMVHVSINGWSDQCARKPRKTLGDVSLSVESGNDENEADAEAGADLMAGEKFVCFVYLNFILNVLLRLRIFALSAGGMYVLLVLSLTSYPFEPRLGIRSFLILLLLLILAVVASVYAQMHRDPTLSRITNTNAGELGADFWLRLVGFAALPTLGLLAAQFPDVGGFLFSWVQPALDALTK